MTEPPAPIESCLTEDKRGMKRAMLEVVACGVVTSGDDVGNYAKCTLLMAQNTGDVVRNAAVAALKWLCRNYFIAWDGESKAYKPLPLGKATLESSLAPDQALRVAADLSRARRGFIMTTDLHLTYLVTPVNEEALQVGWDAVLHPYRDDVGRGN